MNYTGFVADRKEHNTNNDIVLLLIPEQLDSNLEKLNSYYERLSFVKDTECHFQSIMFAEKKYNGEIIHAVIDCNGRECTYDNTILLDINTQKRVDIIRIQNLTVLNKITDSIMAYDLESRTCDVVTDYIIDKKKVSAFKRKNNI